MRTSHLRFEASRYALGKPLFRPCSVIECIVDRQGTCNIGYNIMRAESKAGSEPRIGIMVAGNSGRPGGSVGHASGGAQSVHPNHKTQEEALYSNFLVATCGSATDGARHSAFHYENLYRAWGLDPHTSDTNTIQGIDYTRASPDDYCDVLGVLNGRMCRQDFNILDGRRRFNLKKCYNATLVFVSGPNVSVRGRGPTSTCTRTLNARLATNYTAFRSGVVAAVEAGLDGMIMEGCDIAMLARLSCGIYSK